MSDYIPQDLYNQIIASVPIICVDVIILNKANEALLIKRNQSPAKEEWWLPGGRQYKNELLADCAKRKALEEVGLDCRVGAELLHEETIFDDGPEGIPVHSVNHVYLLRFKGDQEIVLDSTSSDYVWVSEIPKGCHTYIIKCLNKVGLI